MMCVRRRCVASLEWVVVNKHLVAWGLEGRVAARARQAGPSNQRSATPVACGGFGGLRVVKNDLGALKIRGIDTNENSANVAVQIKMLIPAMISSVGTTACGPPARTGHEVKTITMLRSADLRTMLRRLGAGDSLS
jgi:hypothetical protein